MEEMIDTLSAYTLALALAVVSSSALAFVGFARRRVAGALPFALLMLAGAVYALGTIFEIRGASPDELHLWLSVEYLGIAFLGPLWLIMSLAVSGIRSPKFDALIAGLLAFSLLVIGMVWTNGHHRVFYTSIELARRGPFSVSLLGKGPWYWANMACMNGCILAANAMLLRRVARAPSAYRSQALFMFAASLFPWAGMLVYQLGLSPYGLDIAPFGIPLSGLLFSWSLFRHRLLDLGLIAYERIFEGMREGVLVLDRKGRILGLNPAMSAILGLGGADPVGESAARVLAARPELAELVARDPPAEADLRLEGAEGTSHYSAKLSAIAGPRGSRLGSILLLGDITVRIELMQRLSELATVDGLTGISNRRTLLEVAGLELQRARRQGLPLSLVLLDLDHFKEVNDLHGHQAGDEVLKAAARACAACLRATDRFGRYGGEEFLALLPGVGPAEAVAAAERLRAAVEASRVGSGGAEIRVTASLGCSGRAVVGEADALDELIREADAALYRAKAGGRDRVERHRDGA